MELSALVEMGGQPTYERWMSSEEAEPLLILRSQMKECVRRSDLHLETIVLIARKGRERLWLAEATFAVADGLDGFPGKLRLSIVEKSKKPHASRIP